MEASEVEVALVAGGCEVAGVVEEEEVPMGIMGEGAAWVVVVEDITDQGLEDIIMGEVAGATVTSPCLSQTSRSGLTSSSPSCSRAC